MLLAVSGLLFLLAGWSLPEVLAQSNPGEPPPLVLELHFDGPIGPASEDYILAGLEAAALRDAEAVVLRLDTPGGLDSSMRSINKAILSASQPIILFVHPAGSRAASAGTYMLYASHVAAMAPGTNLGAATPVSLGGGSRERSPLPNDGNPGDSQDPGRDPGGRDDASEATGDADSGRAPAPAGGGMSAMEAKVTNDAIAYIRSLAELRNRNADWAEAAVRQAQSLSASRALELGVIDLVARDVPDLLSQADQREVLVNGERVTLDLSGAQVFPYEQNWRIRLLTIITNPNIALILMAIGFYGLVFEFLNPGALVPGTIGGISLLLGAYSLTILPFEIAGIALILLGLALMIAEAFVPSFGVLGIGGVVAFLLGSTLSFDVEIPGFQLAWPVVIATALTSLLFTVLVIRVAMRSRKRKVVTGRRGLIGKPGEVLDWADGHGHVFADGERWSAASTSPLEAGSTVIISGLKGIMLIVEPADNPPVNPPVNPPGATGRR